MSIKTIYGVDGDILARQYKQHISGFEDWELRDTAEEYVLSPSMQLIEKRCFPCAIQVSDRFHVQKLLGEALEEIRIKHRWEAIEAENERIKLEKSQKRQYVPKTYENGETRRQLLARSNDFHE